MGLLQILLKLRTTALLIVGFVSSLNKKYVQQAILWGRRGNKCIISNVVLFIISIAAYCCLFPVEQLLHLYFHYTHCCIEIILEASDQAG